MKVLIVGGAGNVGTWTLPYLKKHHKIRILDLRAPQDDTVEYVQGSITDPAALRQALDGVDTFINMVMKSPTGGFESRAPTQDIIDNYQVNTLGLHLLLYTAQSMGVKKGVHTSTFTVHDRDRKWYPAEEELPFDNTGVYGLTKGFGERICRYFCRVAGMSIIALRLTGPRNRQGWLEGRKIPKDDPRHLWVTDEQDLATAYLAALEAAQRPYSRFDAVFIAGDEGNEEINLSKARTLLGWEPTTHRLYGAPPDPAA